MISEPASKAWFEKHGLPGKKQEIAKKMKTGDKEVGQYRKNVAGLRAGLDASLKKHYPNAEKSKMSPHMEKLHADEHGREEKRIRARAELKEKYGK